MSHRLPFWVGLLLTLGHRQLAQGGAGHAQGAERDQRSMSADPLIALLAVAAILATFIVSAYKGSYDRRHKR